MPEHIVVMGVDPGLQVTGYGVIELRPADDPPRPRLLEGGAIEGGPDRLPLSERLRHLYQGMESVLDEYQPSVVAMEQLYSHYSHPRTAILMAHARGVLCLAAATHHVVVYDYPATEVKSGLTGNGRASKGQIQRSVRQALGLESEPASSDTADALAVALCHAYRMRDHGRSIL